MSLPNDKDIIIICVNLRRKFAKKLNSFRGIWEIGNWVNGYYPIS